MGEAKRRGTKTERKDAAEDRLNAENNKMMEEQIAYYDSHKNNKKLFKQVYEEVKDEEA